MKRALLGVREFCKRHITCDYCELEGKWYGCPLKLYNIVGDLVTPEDWEIDKWEKEIGKISSAQNREWDENSVPFCNVCPKCNAVVERGSVKRNGDLNYCPNCGVMLKREDN